MKQMLKGRSYSEMMYPLRHVSSDIALFERLGFRVTDEKILAPGFDIFLKNYLSLLDEMHVPVDDRILPTLVYKNIRTGEVRLVTPHVDAYPDDPAWQIRANYRLSAKDLYRGIARNRFSVFSDGFHDVFHFISFLKKPAYARALIGAHRKFTDIDPLPFQLKIRNAYLLEGLALADPSKKIEIRSSLFFPRLIDGQPIRLEEVQAFYESFSSERLISAAKSLVKEFPSLILNYAPAVGEPLERAFYRDKLTPNHVIDTLQGKYEEPAYRSLILSPALILQSMSFMGDKLKVLLNAYENDGTDQWSKEDVEKFIRLQAARIEVALWNSANVVTLEQWVRDMATLEIDENSPTYRFLLETVGENSILIRR